MCSIHIVLSFNNASFVLFYTSVSAGHDVVMRLICYTEYVTYKNPGYSVFFFSNTYNE